MAEAKTFNDFLIPSFQGFGTGLRTSAHLLAGFHAQEVADFNVGQIQSTIAETQLAADLDIAQFERAASKLQGQQKTAIATTGFAFSGSLVDLMVDTQAQIELEKLEKRRIADAKIQALQTQQQLTARQGEQAQLGQFLSAGAELSQGLFGIFKGF